MADITGIDLGLPKTETPTDPARPVMTKAEAVRFARLVLSAAKCKIERLDKFDDQEPVWKVTTPKGERAIVEPASGWWSFEGVHKFGLSSLLYHLGLKQPILDGIIVARGDAPRDKSSGANGHRDSET